MTPNTTHQPDLSRRRDSTPQALITASGVVRSFKSQSGEVSAIRGATFTIPDGSFTIVYGPSGSGKSTLLNCLVGLDKPNSGTITYEGRDLYSMTPNERAYFRAHTMGMVYQTNHWVGSMSVVENVALPLTFIGMTRQYAHKMAISSLERVNMQHHASKYPSDLSGGEQQRVALARALVNNPSFIIADEPTGNLDTKAGDEVIELLRYFNKTLRRTVILVTHNPSYLPVGDQLLTIKDGVVTMVTGGDLQQVKKSLFTDVAERMNYWKGVA